MVDCYSCIARPTLLPSIFPTTTPSNSSSSSSAVSINFSPKSTLSFLRNTTTGLASSRRRSRIIYAAASTGRSTTNPPDYYKALKLRKNATLQEIKTSYRALARKYHPDMNKSDGAEDKFKEISAAYEVLSDEEKRSVYDRFGEAGLQGNYDGSGTGFQEVDPFQVFGTFFGDSNDFFGGTNNESGENSFNFRSKGTHSLNIRHDIFLSFEESIFGAKRDIEVSCFETCDYCGGTGAKSRNCIKSCNHCGGRGAVMQTQETPFGVMSQVSSCSKCGGDGKIITESCQYCRGEGNVQKTRSVKVVIPPGVRDEDTMGIQGEGNVDKKRGRVGDLYVVIHVKQKRGIRRDGLDLYSEINIDYSQAILGTVIKVETVDGLKDLQVPSGTQPGETIKMSKMGAPDVNKPSVRGHHHFIVNVRIPKYISKEERLLVKKLAAIRHHTINGQKDDTFDKHKKDFSSSYTSKKTGTSIWSSIRDMFGGRQSGDRFASTSVCTSVYWKHNSPSSPTMLFTVIIFMLTCICNTVKQRQQ